VRRASCAQPVHLQMRLQSGDHPLGVTSNVDGAVGKVQLDHRTNGGTAFAMGIEKLGGLSRMCCWGAATGVAPRLPRQLSVSRKSMPM
jgi:hypothetical protein